MCGFILAGPEFKTNANSYVSDTGLSRLSARARIFSSIKIFELLLIYIKLNLLGNLIQVTIRIINYHIIIIIKIFSNNYAFNGSSTVDIKLKKIYFYVMYIVNVYYNIKFPTQF